MLRVLQKRPSPDTAFCIGKGKAGGACPCAVRPFRLIWSSLTKSSPGSCRKIWKKCLRIEVVDRTALILDIFAARASTREGKLQVEMAQLKYRSQRLLGQGLVLCRLAGGIGTRGPGESKLEVNRRRIRERLTDLRPGAGRNGEAARPCRRQSREKDGVPVVALVGYTNAGKSTLFNRLTGADVYVQDQLFATLDSVSRPVNLPHGAKAPAGGHRWALSASCPTKWSRPSMPRWRRPGWPTCWCWCPTGPTPSCFPAVIPSVKYWTVSVP